MIGRAMLLMGVIGLAFWGGCGDETSCKGACDKLSSCGLKSAGLSCDEGCDQGGRAGCVGDSSCEEIGAGECAGSCPGVSFTKK